MKQLVCCIPLGNRERELWQILTKTTTYITFAQSTKLWVYLERTLYGPSHHYHQAYFRPMREVAFAANDDNPHLGMGHLLWSTIVSLAEKALDILRLEDLSLGRQREHVAKKLIRSAPKIRSSAWSLETGSMDPL